MTKSIVSILAVVLLAAAPATAEEVMVVERGTDGLVAVPFRAVNGTSRPIACGAATAHWYSAAIGTAEPGGAVETTLWSNPANGAVYVLNVHQDRMPVASLWCGAAGADVSTGRRILLEHRAGVAEPAIAVECRPDGEKGLDCLRRPGP